MADNSSDPAELNGVLETALYVDDLPAAEHFYNCVLGLRKIFFVPGRQLVFQNRDSILLVFNPSHTERERVVINGGDIPFHGARGAGHMAFRVARQDLDTWRRRLVESGVKIESEVAWPNGAHSIYFRDPAGNSLEFATPDMWQPEKAG